jgi:hypothetical protein
MSRRSVAWLLTIPLAVVGSQLAHALAYRLATGSDRERSHELASSGHAYLTYAPIVLAICAALVLIALVHELRTVFAGHAGRSPRPSAVSFAVLAPAIFVGQEHFERLLHSGTFAPALVFERTFLLGLAMQVPFALIAYVCARLLLGAARVVARLLAVPRVFVLRRQSRWTHAEVRAPRTRPYGLTRGPRGPPAFRAA